MDVPTEGLVDPANGQRYALVDSTLTTGDHAVPSEASNTFNRQDNGVSAPFGSRYTQSTEVHPSQHDSHPQSYTTFPVYHQHQAHPHLLARPHSVSSTGTWTSSSGLPQYQSQSGAEGQGLQYSYLEPQDLAAASTSSTSSTDERSPGAALATFAGQSVTSAVSDGGETPGGQSVTSGFARAAYARQPLRLQPAPPGRQHMAYASSSITSNPPLSQKYQHPSSSSLPSITRPEANSAAGTGPTNTLRQYGSEMPSIVSTFSRPLSSRSLDQLHEVNQTYDPARHGDYTPGSRPSSARSPPTDWPRDDILSLIYVLNEVDGRSWTEIAKRAFIDDKYTASQCQAKWRELSKEKKIVNRGPSSFEEDQALLDAVQLLGPEKWVVIATQVGARNGKQCRERWHNHLSPSIKKGPFTAEEDETIFHWYSKVGSRWSEIAKHLPGRPDNMIKNHFNTSLQRQRRRQRNEQADKVAKMPGSGSSATSVSHEALERAASNATTRLEDVMNSVRSAATEISDDKLLSSTSSMSKSSSSASSASCLGPVEASNRGMPSTAAESGMFPAPSLPDTISQSPATKHSEHRPPTPSSTKSSIPASITTPAPAMRLTRSDHKMGYHPYARISQASPRRFQPNPRSNTEGDLHVEPVRPRNQHLTPPTTPETESHLSYQRAGTGSAVAAPISAPSSLQHFDVAPITPTRRLTLAGSASSSTSRGISTRYPSSLEMFPVTSTTQAMQSMVFGSKTSTLPPDPGSSGPLPLSEQDEHHSPPLTVQAPRAMHLSSLLSSSLENSPVLGLGLSAPQPYPFTARNVVDSSPTAYAQRGQHTFASAGNQSNPYPHQQPHPSQWGYGTSSHGTMYYNSRHDSITSSGELVSAGLRSPMSTFQSPQSYGGGFPSTSSSVGSYYYNTALTSPASSATYSTTYARKYSTSESPSAFASGLPHAPDQYAFFQTEPPQPFTQGSGSYHEILPVEGSREGRSRVQNGSGMDQSPSDVFSAAASGQGFNAGYSWVSGPSGSLSNQPIREEQEEYSQRESQPDAVKERHLAQRSSITGL